MGLIASIFRDDYDSTANAFHGKRQVTIVNIPGPFEPTPERPAAMLIAGPFAGEPNPIIVPARQPDVNVAGAAAALDISPDQVTGLMEVGVLARIWVEDRREDHAGPMFGGTYAGSSDSRFGEAVRGLLGDPDPASHQRPPFRTASVRSPIPVHDRFEPWSQR